MEWLDEYEKLVIRMNMPRVVIDNAICPTATLVQVSELRPPSPTVLRLVVLRFLVADFGWGTLVRRVLCCAVLQVDSARKRGLLLEAVQVLADLDLSINKAYISSDGRWFMDVFHVTDRLGRKLTDDSVITYIQQVARAAFPRPILSPCPRPPEINELPFTDDAGLPFDLQSLGTWNEPARPAALEGLTALELTGPDRTGLLSEVFAVLADMQCSVVDARAWTHRGRLACVVFLRGEELASGASADDDDRVARILARLGHLLRGDGEAPGAVAAVPAAGVAHADRRLHQLMAADLDRAPSFPAPALSPAVSVQSWAERGYSVVTVLCRDRPKLLFDVVCTLHDMDYVVFHGTVDTAGDRARQEFYIRRADGSPIRSEAERERLNQCLQAAIERRSLEVN